MTSTVHVAILLEKYVRLILQGSKTVECRLTRTARVPYRQIKPGDRIYFKQSSGPYRATAVAGRVEFFDGLSPGRVDRFRRRFNRSVCGDALFWSLKKHSRFATFIELQDVEPIEQGPIIAPSRGPAWFILDDKNLEPMHEPRRCGSVSPRSRGEIIDHGLSGDWKDNREGRSFRVVLTQGAIRNRYIRPPRFVLGSTRHTSSDRCDDLIHNTPGVLPMTLILPDGRTVHTYVTSRGMIHWRGWASVFESHAASVGDGVEFEHLSGQCYRVRVVRAAKR